MARVVSETASAVVRISCEMLPPGMSSSTNPYMSRMPPLQSSSLHSPRSRAGRMCSNFGLTSGEYPSKKTNVSATSLSGTNSRLSRLTAP